MWCGVEVYSTPENNMLQYILLLIHTVPTFTPCIQWGEECSNQAAEMGRTLGTEPWDKGTERRRRFQEEEEEEEVPVHKCSDCFSLCPPWCSGKTRHAATPWSAVRTAVLPFFLPPVYPSARTPHSHSQQAFAPVYTVYTAPLYSWLAHASVCRAPGSFIDCPSHFFHGMAEG